MAKERAITNEGFDVFLRWLDPDRESAGAKYEKIRGKLIRLLSGRGCFEPECLADEVINRVVIAAPRLIDDYEGAPELYFYGVAKNVLHEWLRSQSLSRRSPAPIAQPNEEIESEHACLEECLSELPRPERELIINYYTKEKREKIEFRRQLAESMGIGPNALHIRVSRIRSRLRECVDGCLKRAA